GAGVETGSPRTPTPRKVTTPRKARTVSKWCMAFAPLKVTFRRASLNVPLRPRRHAHRLHRADPALVSPYHARTPRARAVGRRLDAGAGHAAVGAVPPIHGGPGRDRGHGGPLPRRQPGPPTRA